MGDDENGNGNGNDNGADDEVESVGAEDALEEAQNRRKPPAQALQRSRKSSSAGRSCRAGRQGGARATKGAALTQPICSWPGRYSVLMPQPPARSAGISRKINRRTRTAKSR